MRKQSMTGHRNDTDSSATCAIGGSSDSGPAQPRSLSENGLTYCDPTALTGERGWISRLFSLNSPAIRLK